MSPIASTIRTSYASLVKILRNERGAPINGSPTYVWNNPQIVFDEDLNVPGQMLCRIDLQWIRPGTMIPAAYEIGAPIPRRGTLLFDTTYDDKILIQAGDKIQTIAGPVEGTFSLRIKPEPAIDAIGVIDHAEVEIVEEGILTKNRIPGKDPM